jgi:two-component system, chemotaxis family, protein-glutamate methylesterase/glutaminase
VIRVFVVDDSAVVREVIASLLAGERDISLIGSASDPVFALPKMERDWPDVLILDMEMPRMDGLTFLRQVMATRPTPIIVCSSLTTKGAQISLDALAAGAVQLLPKPKERVGTFLQEERTTLLEAVRNAAHARVRAGIAPGVPTKVAAKQTADAVLDAPTHRHAVVSTTDRLVAIGTSTGGTQALEFLARTLPPDVPGMVVVQHMPEAFTRAFAERLDSVSRLQVHEARGGERVVTGRMLIAPGGRHLLIKRSGAQYITEVVDGPPVNRHRPSVDVLFRSVARAAGGNALGILMTGMGDDGARGLKEMRDANAHTVAQDEKSCVVYGMPREAVRLNAAQRVMDLHDIPDSIVRHGHG